MSQTRLVYTLSRNIQERYYAANEPGHSTYVVTSQPVGSCFGTLRFSFDALIDHSSKMSLYHDYYDVYVKRYVDIKTKKCCRKEVTELWNAAKKRFPIKSDLVLHVRGEIEKLLREAAERKARTTLKLLNNKVA